VLGVSATATLLLNVALYARTQALGFLEEGGDLSPNSVLYCFGSVILKMSTTFRTMHEASIATVIEAGFLLCPGPEARECSATVPAAGNPPRVPKTLA
jgi:hypothetical protein